MPATPRASGAPAAWRGTRRRGGWWIGCGAVLCASAWLASAQAAEVVDVAAAGRQVFVQLRDGEVAAVGDSVLVGNPPVVMQIVVIVGHHLRLQGERAANVKPHAAVKLPQTAGLGGPPKPREWKVAHVREPTPAMAREAEVLRWQEASQQWAPFVADPRLRGRDPEQRLDGQVTLTAAGVVGAGENWALLRLGNALRWQGIGGTPLTWQHDAALWLEQWAREPGVSSSRAMQVRQAALSLDTTPMRTLGGSLGRVWVPEGAGSATVDGATLALRPHPQVEITGFAGLLPSITSTALQSDAWRTGLGAIWRGEVGEWQGTARLNWSGGKIAAAWDRQVGGLTFRGLHPRLGKVSGELELAAGQADLSGTAWASQGPAPSGVRPLRAMLDVAPGYFSTWPVRLRYSYQRSELTRELAMLLPNQGWSTARGHGLSAWLDAPAWRGVHLAGSAWTSYTASEDKWESWRVGGTLQANVPGWPGPRWNGRATAIVQTGPYLLGGSLSAGADWMPTQNWRWHTTLRWSHDRVQTSSSSDEALDVRGGVDWGRHPWVLGLSVGGRKTVWSNVATRIDWLDVAATLTYRF